LSVSYANADHKSSNTAISLADYIEAEDSLHSYIRQAWHIVEPGRPFVDNWHIGAMSECLEAASRGEIRNLALFVPPRGMKSLTVDAFFPTWIWGPQNRPETRWMFSSYADSLAVRDNVKRRDIIRSPWFQHHWGSRFKLKLDQNQKHRFENDRAGFNLAVGVGGSITGEGADFLVTDDPHKADEVESDTIRTGVHDFWDYTWSTRANDPQSVVRILIMQRLHPDDLWGHIQEKEEGRWTVLCLPMRYERTAYLWPLSWPDPRQQEGELLFPERFPEKEVKELEETLGKSGVASQLQQRPEVREGGIFQRSWWNGKNRYVFTERAHINRTFQRFGFMDVADKVGADNAWTVNLFVDVLPEYQLLLRNVYRKRLDFPSKVQHCKDIITAENRDGKLAGFIIEDKATGVALIQQLQAELRPDLAKLVIPFNPQGDKPTRAINVSRWCERGGFWLPYPHPECEWLPVYEDELFKAPACKFWDQVDTTSMALSYLWHFLEAWWQGHRAI